MGTFGTFRTEGLSELASALTTFRTGTFRGTFRTGTFRTEGLSELTSALRLVWPSPRLHVHPVLTKSQATRVKDAGLQRS